MASARDVSYADTLSVRDNCLCLHTQRAARALARRFDAAFRSLKLTNGQFSLLMSLNRPEPASMGSLSILLAMDRTTLTAALKSLTQRGLVSVEADAKDRRTRRVRLTDTGTDLLAQAMPIWRSTHESLEREMAGEGDGLRVWLRRME